MSLRVSNLVASYKDLKVLWGVSFEVNEGEIVSLIGSNSAGKTTTLRAIAGILPADEGEISFNGEVVSRLSVRERVKRGLGLVPEGGELFPYMSVEENLELGAYLPGARSKTRESMERVFHLFPRLQERKKQLAVTLSGGERQMLAIGRALMASPKMIMLDEPSLGLAPSLVLELIRTIKELNAEGYTILLVEQNVSHALKLSRRSYVLENGRIALSGEGPALLNDPKVKEAYLGL